MKTELVIISTLAFPSGIVISDPMDYIIKTPIQIEKDWGYDIGKHQYVRFISGAR